MVGAIAGTSLGFLVKDSQAVMATGKMLRSRLAYRVGTSTGVPRNTLAHASAAVELIHTASLLHDDVIDGGTLRRGAPAFWVERGVAGAILLGDLLLFKGVDLICQVENGRLTHSLVKLTGEVCEAESEQELLLQGDASRLEQCLNIARRKTGALFAFAAEAAGGEDLDLSALLQEAGYAVGTAYQLADDVLDATGDPSTSDKTLGTDQRRDIISAALVNKANGEDAVTKIYELCDKSAESLAAYPDAQKGFRAYMDMDILPSLNKLLAGAK